MHHMKLICAFVFALLVQACSSGDAAKHGQDLKQWMTRNNKVKVLSTIAMIDDVVKDIGGEYVDHTVLISGELDPHSYQLVKGDDEKFAFADLIFYSGLGLEHGPSLQKYLRKSPKAIGLGDKIEEAEPSLILHYKGQIDPHIWMDISLWAKIIPHIVAALSQQDPRHAEEFRTQGNKLMQEMLQKHQAIQQQLQSIPSEKRYLVTSHDAFSYFTRAYLAEPGETEKEWQERFAAPEGLAPESQLSTTDIQNIINHLRQYRIHVLFPESNVNRDSIKKIVNAAKGNGMHVKIADTPLYGDAMGKPGSDGDTYLKMIMHNAATLTELLKNNGN